MNEMKEDFETQIQKMKAESEQLNQKLRSDLEIERQAATELEAALERNEGQLKEKRQKIKSLSTEISDVNEENSKLKRLVANLENKIGYLNGDDL